MFATKIRTMLAAAFCLAVVGAIFTPVGWADDWNKRTLVTIDRPIEVPRNIVLAPGTYLFEVVEVPGVRNVVRISSEDGTKVYTTVFGIWDFKLNPSDETILEFYEAPKGMPEALRTWFYPAHQYGFSFVYPRKRAVEIATVSGEPVLAEKFEAPPAVSEEPLSEVFEEPIVVVEPTGEEWEFAEIHPPEISAEPPFVPEVAVPEPAPEPVAELPKTATPLPLLGLIGLIAAVGASAMRIFRG
jgi:hypothetical protein